jgi:hypothetical protein
LERFWAILIGSRKAAGKCPKVTGSFWAILKGSWKAAGKYPNSRRQPLGEEAELPAIGKNVAISL